MFKYRCVCVCITLIILKTILYLSTELDVLNFKYKYYPKMVYSSFINHIRNLIYVLNCIEPN